jgi:hypothetical protein
MDPLRNLNALGTWWDLEQALGGERRDLDRTKHLAGAGRGCRRG